MITIIQRGGSRRSPLAGVFALGVRRKAGRMMAKACPPAAALNRYRGPFVPNGLSLVSLNLSALSLAVIALA